MILDFRQDKRMIRLIEKRVNGFDQFGLRPPVSLKREPSVRVTCRFQVGEHIGAPEAIDRLLRIAGVVESMFGVAEDLLENLVLRRISVLKFVSQHGAITCCPRPGQPYPASAV